MGSLHGHLVPGSMFITLSVWWYIGEILQKTRPNATARANRTRGKQRSTEIPSLWYFCPCERLAKFPAEPLIKVVFAVLGILGELPGSNATSLFDSSGELVPSHVDNYAHSMMYGFFGLTGVVDLVIWYKVLPLPPKFEYLVFSLAFWIEGFLFFFHLDGRDELNVRLHTILYIIVFVTAAVFLSAVFSDQFIPFMGFLKAYLISLQGSWFFQTGFVLFGPSPWKNVHSNVEFLGIVFAFHALVLFIVHLTGHIICYHCYIKKRLMDEGLPEDSPGDDTELMLLEQQ